MNAFQSEQTDKCARSIAFVVPALNEERHLERCLRSIEVATQSAACGSRIIVVDNGSTDATVELARRCGAEVIFVPPGNAGRARNAGARQITESACAVDFFAFVDADCVLPDSWLTVCLEHFTAADRAAVVAVGAIQAIPPATAPWVERTWVRTISPKFHASWDSVDWLPAFNLLVRRADFEAIGGFDETLTTCEDSDLGYRLSQRGQLRREHRCPVLHLGESQSLREFFRRELWRSRGNFRSAWKRGAIGSEFATLGLPVVYVMVAIANVVTLGLAAALGGIWWWMLAGAIVAMAGLPVAISVFKRGIQQLASTSLLMMVYLLARGCGPFVAAGRVHRTTATPQSAQ